MGISIDGKDLSAVCTGKAVMGIPVHLILMRIPPGHPAFVGAELLRTVFPLGDCAAAIHADRLFSQFGISQTIAPAERFDCIDGYSGLR